MYKEALNSYKEALALSERYLGKDDSISINLRETYEKAEKAIEEHRRQQRLHKLQQLKMGTNQSPGKKRS